MPAVSALCVKTGVAGLAERHEILIIIGTAFSKRLDVVDHHGDRRLSILSANLAERVVGKVGLADSPPVIAVMLRSLRVALITIVPQHLLLLVKRAESAVGKVGAARMAAGFLRSERHFLPSCNPLDREIMCTFAPRFSLCRE